MNDERRKEEGTGLSLMGKQCGEDCEQKCMVYDGGKGHCECLSLLCAAYPGGLPFTASVGGWRS